MIEVHSISVFDSKDWERFVNGEMVIADFPYDSSLKEICKVNCDDIYDQTDPYSEWTDYQYLTYETFDKIESYDKIFKKIDNCVILSVCDTNELI